MCISDYHKMILRAEICPYCKSETKKVSEEFIYKRTYKNRDIICCVNYPKCNSYVGTHDDGTPLGRLANESLRKAKINAHYWFDKIWKKKYRDRSVLYEDLSKFFMIPLEYTHIGMFSENTCVKTMNWAKNTYFYYENRNARNTR